MFFKKIFLPFVLISFVAISSCKKENENPLIFVSPSYLVMDATAGEVITFYVNTSASKGVKRFQVFEKESTSFSTLILDSVVDGTKKFSFNYEYLVRSKAADYSVALTFKMIDNDGNETSAPRTLNVKHNFTPLTENTGNIMYSKMSGKADAYDLVNLSPLFSGISKDSVQDIKNANDTDSSHTLSRAWVSPAGGKFVMYSGFDYVNATKNSVVNAYNSGTKLDKVTDLKADDIIITRLGRDSATYAAIKIVAVVDEDSTHNDRYIFNVKK
ncbi:MAG TPA: hypothetical protein VIK89_06260 [Cytophagaceae bacterium]